MPETCAAPVVDLIAWLRALPVGTVVLDSQQDAWQLTEQDDGVLLGMRATFLTVGDSHQFVLSSDEDMRDMACWAPFTVIWMPPVDLKAAT